MGGRCWVQARTGKSFFRTALPLIQTRIQLAREEELIRIQARYHWFGQRIKMWEAAMEWTFSDTQDGEEKNKIEL